MTGLLFLFVAALGASDVRSQEGGAQGLRIETEHLVLEWVDAPDSLEVEGVKAEASRLYASVAARLGEEPEGKVTIVLGGFAERPGGGREYPRVVAARRVLLFKFVPDYRNYFGALAHELVHVTRFDRRRTADWFFEEGFAEFVALRADTSLAGFPWFDFPVTVVAGQWLAAGEDIPLIELSKRHDELNQKCGAQGYALRASFFDWLGRTHGDDVVLRASREAHAGALEDYEKFFGKPFGQLEQDWRSAVLAEYEATPGAGALAQRFRRESPVKYQKVCLDGVDF
jgi:hypothetical protein